MGFDPRIIVDYFPDLLVGLLGTFKLVPLALLLGLLLTIPLSLMRVSKNPWLSLPVYAYTYYFRGTPLLIQLFLIYYGIGQFDWIKETFLWTYFREAYWCCLLAFTLNTSAYTTEIMRGAIQNVPLGEIEAARACGMSKALLYRRIIFPRAFRLMLPAYSNEVIFTLQASALASVVTFMDLTGAARVIIAKTFGYNEVFIPVAAMYLVLTYLIDWAFRKTEYRLSGHLRDRSAIAAKEPVVAVPGH